MEYTQVIAKRRSTRAFTREAVPDTVIEAVLAAIRSAPTAGNRQAFQVYLVTNPEVRAALSRAANNQRYLEEAPLCLVFLADPGQSAERYGKRGAELYALQDATIATTLAWLSIVDQGLASVWIGAFDDAAVTAAIASPAHLRPVAMLPIGHEAETPRPTPRRPLTETVTRLD